VEEHPNIHDAVVLRDPVGREYPSRVENLGPRLVVVTQPHSLPSDEVFGNGTEISVTWADSDGAVMVLPTRILAAHADGPLQLWSLVVSGPPTLEQRRRVERVEVAAPVTLRSAEDGTTVSGHLVDVSENAIRCSVAAGSVDRFLQDRGVIVAEFSLGSKDFAVPGRAEFLRPTKHPTLLEELVVLFDSPFADAEALRAQLGAEQASSSDEGRQA